VDPEQRAAFDTLVATRTAALVRTAYLMTGDWQHAEDLVQASLAKTYLRWHRLREPAAAEAYTRAVLARSCTRAWRRRWRGEVPTQTLPDVTARDAVADTDERVVLARALATLPAAQRAVLVLRFYEDLSEAETATVLGCAPGTVKSRTARALAALRETGLVEPALVRPVVLEGPA
jgi:RNA polymerase sigma-70 factor (sigma-E family)